MKAISRSADPRASLNFTPKGCLGPTNPFLNFAKEDIEQSIPDRFEQQVAKYPERIAVKTKSSMLSYRELNEAANRLAWSILDRPGRTEEPIALLFDNGASFVTASIAAMKAGAIQVSLESTFPKARLRSMLDQSQACVLVTDEANLPLARELTSLPVTNVDRLSESLATTNPRLPLVPDANVAIGYTSGSTGQPKGIVWNHRGMLHAVMRHTNTFHICGMDRVVMFRAALRPSLYALLNGATYFPVNLRAFDPASLADWLMHEEITVYRAPVSAFRTFAGGLGKAVFHHLRLILLFGEPAYHTDVELFAKYFSNDAILGVSLGCNEFDDYACFFLDKHTPLAAGAIPAGYPIADTEVLIVDERGRSLDINQTGEIVIRSPYNAVGYWRRPDLTEAAFSPDPDDGNECLYHTGDLGRREADGRLFHQGRKDSQIKIRGYGVEVSEVEAALLEIDGVREAVVVGREKSPGESALVGYLIWTGAEPPRISELRRQLAEKLPDYMVPSSFVFLYAFPLTATGKVDRRALPAPDGMRPAIDNAFVAPRTVVEEEVAAIWAEVLGLDRVGAYDPFLDLGGDSLLATQVISRVFERWQRQIPLRVLFDAPTVAKMAEWIDSGATESEDFDGPPPVLRRLP